MATPYPLSIGIRYLRSKKRATVSVISVIAVTGVALGVGALLSVVSITSGFQDEFRDKVLGVNAHVLVLKYGLNFDEYRDVVQRANKLPETVGAAPFIINEMMLAKGDRLSGVLIKGVDPQLMPKVLDLPSQLIAGSLEGIRRPGARPATRTQDLNRDVGKDEAQDLDLARRQSRDISWCGGGNATKVAMDLAESGSKGRVRGSCDDRREVLERSC